MNFIKIFLFILVFSQYIFSVSEIEVLDEMIKNHKYEEVSERIKKLTLQYGETQTLKYYIALYGEDYFKSILRSKELLRSDISVDKKKIITHKLSELYYLYGNYGEAEVYYQKLLSFSLTGMERDEAIFKLGLIKLNKRDYMEADKIFAQLKIKYRSSFLYGLLNRSRIAYDEGAYKKSLALITSAINAFSERSYPYSIRFEPVSAFVESLLLSALSYEKLGDFARASLIFDYLVQYFSDTKAGEIAISKKRIFTSRAIIDRRGIKLPFKLPDMKVKGYSLQLGIFKDKDKAEKLVKKLKRKKLNIRVEKVKTLDKEFFRVVVGRYENFFEAEAFKKELLFKEGISSFIIRYY